MFFNLERYIDDFEKIVQSPKRLNRNFWQNCTCLLIDPHKLIWIFENLSCISEMTNDF